MNNRRVKNQQQWIRDNIDTGLSTYPGSPEAAEVGSLYADALDAFAALMQRLHREAVRDTYDTEAFAAVG